MTARFTVFLDRDGVFNKHPRFQVRRYKDLEWLPGARKAFSRLNRPDIQTALCTNQPGTGALLSTPGMIRRLHASFQQELERRGGRMDRIEACYSALPSRRRKPRPGMLEDAAAAFAASGSPVDKRRAVMVGDKIKDARAGAAFGIPTILVATTYDAARLEAKAGTVPYAAIVPDLAAAVGLILAWAGDE